jgi:hypothetical protein
VPIPDPPAWLAARQRQVTCTRTDPSSPRITRPGINWHVALHESGLVHTHPPTPWSSSMDRPHHFPLLIAGIALGACGPASEASTDVPPSAETTLVIADFAFEERAVAAHASVRVINQDGVPHTVTGEASTSESDRTARQLRPAPTRSPARSTRRCGDACRSAEPGHGSGTPVAIQNGRSPASPSPNGNAMFLPFVRLLGLLALITLTS